MAVRPVRITGDPVLHTRTREVTTFDAGLRELVDDMFETMYAAHGVGLAANQIGVDLRVFVYDCPDAEGTWHAGVVVNPAVETSALPSDLPTTDDNEGCLSVPGETFPTGRASWAKVTGVDLDGNAIAVEATGVLARCFQHETDHLDGHLYVERLVGDHAVAAKTALAAQEENWREQGNRWLPERPDGVDGPVGRDIPLPSGKQRGPLNQPGPAAL